MTLIGTRQAADERAIATLADQPTAVLSEATLFHAHRAGPAALERTLPCACGGWITASEDDVELVMRAHTRGAQHLGWRAIAFPPRPTVVPDIDQQPEPTTIRRSA